jgi:pyruvate dehydrogenase E2 component (dihydrolipoamide acetyltransferase)
MSIQHADVDRRCGRIVASPRARRAMRQRAIDPTSVRGTGPGGRIVEADVLRAATRAAHAAAGLRVVDASPSFCLRAVADVTSLVLVQRQIADEVQRLCGTPLRLGDLLLRAAAIALAECPEANRVWQHSALVAPAHANVAFEPTAFAGRTAPTIQRADRLRLVDLVRRRAELAEASGMESLLEDAHSCAALCVCDLSAQPVDEYVAMLRPPHTSALGAGRAARRPYVVDGALSMRQTMRLCLSADARALAPETAAALLGRIVDGLQRPFVLCCERPQP